MARSLSAHDIRELLSDLIERISRRGEAAEVRIIGGAAVALQNPARTSTYDIDGYIRLVDATDLIRDVQRDWGLDDEWFNWRAQGLQPPVAGAEMWHEVMRKGQVVLYSANSDALLAMKLRAARAKDMPDIAFLMEACDIRSIEDAEQVFERFYPGDALSDVATARVRHVLEAQDTRPPLS